MSRYISILLFLFFSSRIIAQTVPAVDENIPYLVTFGKAGDTAWGDDDFTQMIFFSVPEDYKTPIYIRIYDADTGGNLDELKGVWNSKMTYSIYGGVGACSNKDIQKFNLKGNYKSGTLLQTKIIGENAKYDQNWLTIGPFNPTEGELLPEYGGYIFKIIVEGTIGDDGNLYKLSLSSQAEDNRGVEGAFAFYFKYKFRMHDNVEEIAHIYPYIDDRVIAIKQSNFDWDSDGFIRIISSGKNGEIMKASEDNLWQTSEHKIVSSEKNSSLDIQLIKNKTAKIKNNNVVIFLENQYGERLPFYSVPIGGVPKYKYSIGIRPQKTK